MRMREVWSCTYFSLDQIIGISAYFGISDLAGKLCGNLPMSATVRFVALENFDSAIKIIFQPINGDNGRNLCVVIIDCFAKTKENN